MLTSRVPGDLRRLDQRLDRISVAGMNDARVTDNAVGDISGL
jgi:hypothetical protein